MFKLATALLLSFVVLAVPAQAKLNFKPCGKSGFECAILKAPLDYDEPGGPTVSLAVTRLRAANRAKSLGPLLINYGGPGGGAADLTRRIGPSLFGAYIRRFDLVALDPRGTGKSSPRLDCRVNQETAGIYRHPFARPEPVSPERQVTIATDYANRCVERNQSLAPHVSTANVARDMDLLRAQLGEEKISYFGFSYGTLLGATYAAMFGDHLRAAVLDGALDPDSYLVDPNSGLRTQTLGLEQSLDRYFAACKRAKCRWTRGADPEKAYDALVAKADANPIRGGRAPVNGDEINFAVAGELYAKQLWPELTQALDEARSGDSTLLRQLSDDSYGRRDGGKYSPDTDRYFMIGAAEQAYGTDPQEIIDLEPANYEEFPHFFFNSGFAQVPYTLFSARDEDAFREPFGLPASTPRVLVVGNTFDPATPYVGAKALTQVLGRARLLTMRGDGHTAYGGNSPCIDRLVDRYVIKLQLPPNGTKCRQRVPFEALVSASAASTGGVDRAAPSAPLAAPFAGLG